MLPPRRDRSQGAGPPRPQPGQPRTHPRFGERPAASPDQYRSLRASLLFCPTCRQATPTRERLLLVLPTGNLYEYLCVQCGTSTGSKTEREQGETRLFLP